MIFFLRHAQSESNQKGIYAGSGLDTKLTDSGIAKLKEIASKNTIIFKKVYVSCLSRSIESGKIFLAEQPYSAQIIPDKRINELDFGGLTGLPYIDIDFNTKQAYEDYSIETSQAFHDRVLSFYNDLKNQDGPILILAHAGIGKMLQTIVSNSSVAEYNQNQDFEQYKIYQL